MKGAMPGGGVDLSNKDYRLHRQRQVIEAYQRKTAYLEKLVADMKFDTFVLRGNLEELSAQESRVIDPLDSSGRWKKRCELAYGIELVMDLYGCDAARFNRDWIGWYFDELCASIDMELGPRHFWDDVGVDEEDRQTDPKTQGTSAVQFILTSTIVVHTLDQLRQVYVNVFSCKTFDVTEARDITMNFFAAQCCEPHVIVRG